MTQVETQRPFVLSIGGFDPSGGAGVLADIKTFEALGVQGLSVITSNTVQTDNDFKAIYPIHQNEILEQLVLILKRFNPKVIKIGLVPDFEALEAILNLLKGRTIIWDSVLKASAGFEFHNSLFHSKVEHVLKNIALVTPNWNEAKELFNLDEVNVIDHDTHLNQIVAKTRCCILLKGGHTEEEKAIDRLYTPNEIFEFEGKRFNGFDKHGTGCMLSSAITANIASGRTWQQSCSLAKDFVAERMLSNTSLLAYFA